MDRIVFLGTSAGAPTRTRNVTSHCVLTRAGRVWMLDCGEGTQHRVLACDAVKPTRIDVILITHTHGDHLLGLPGLLSSLSLGGNRAKPVRVFGPVGVKRFLETAIEVTDAFLTYKLEITELTPGEARELGIIDGIKLSAHPLVHRVPCFGYVLEETVNEPRIDPAKAASIGVTGKLIGQLARGDPVTLADGTVVTFDQAENAMCSCTSGAMSPEMAVGRGHSTSTMTGAFAKAIEAKKLILTHFSSRYSDGKAGQADSEPAAFAATRETTSAAGSAEVTDIAGLVAEAQAACPDTEVVAASDFAIFTID
ncbi:hypothetical protein CAOG_09171 [Capsaspora owczarzaki ATCC 30864]|uniref:Metallo-beta-lactamase domain-containing protein n=1 Tax=Capsaspora owczarzaki (strain ATCC 30864) TaxID=595528 RepID=A0A0D2WYR5_CAPO3|nr:hypothetical protein CAOG_09171 [Capsaspora owczarzaki ATCC 30864]KJE98173.1 hypothetical protein CAOG_009171 [Capsaspora owczarzaki ATCC 30864]|eukprot:XP_011270884.1 hypothetical protein CAOG_09171 [Capsaspora owczarzaki ATCC 30864]